MSHLTMSQFATRRDFEQAQAAQAAHGGKQLAVYYPDREPRFIIVGTRACVVIAEHPEEGQRGIEREEYVNTSTVQWHNAETGVFETLNTRYVPAALVS